MAAAAQKYLFTAFPSKVEPKSFCWPAFALLAFSLNGLSGFLNPQKSNSSHQSSSLHQLFINDQSLGSLVISILCHTVSATSLPVLLPLELSMGEVYKQKTESAKKDYLKQLAAYRANLLSKGNDGSCILQPCGEYFNQRKFLFPQTFPDSTGVITEATQASHEFGSKTLASLIAEPAPQQMLTATTTLTVPQSSYSSVEPAKFRLNTFASGDGRFGIEADCRKTTVGSPEWEQENNTAIDDCVIRYCRDAFDDWVECGRPQRPHTYAPV
ncbi:hypothetical protein D918_03886 [Trichuris suis]|nr:hypothetical protein D918_03886 [Trichuris suis]